MTSVERPEWTVQAPARRVGYTVAASRGTGQRDPVRPMDTDRGADGAAARSESRSATQPTYP